MNDSDRFERRLPDLMAELAPPRLPDYFDDMLRATARTRQRPAWTSLERLLPMEISARPAPLGLPSWRPLVAVLVVVSLLVAAGAVLIAGSQRALPPLFGPAGNGLVIYSTNGGDILSLDPATGRTATVIGGSTDDRYPGLSPDGQRFIFVRLASGADTLYTANVDGSGIKELGPAKDTSWVEWSSDSKRIVAIADGGGTPVIHDVSTGNVAALPVSSPVNIAQWLTDAKLLLAAQPEPDGSRTYWTINADGTGQTLLNTPDACCGASVLPGTELLAWTSWSTGGGARTHVLATASGLDRVLASTEIIGSHFLDPTFSPDGKWLTASRFDARVEGKQLVLLAADGSGAPVSLGARFPTNEAEIRATFSPDGKQLLVTYDDGSAWLFTIPSGTGAQVAWPGLVHTSWQRLAVAP